MAKTDAALALAARGLRVFPLLPNSHKPAWEGWTDFATTEPERIRAWWDGADYNIGVCTTGLLVVDIDAKPDKVTGAARRGPESWAALGHGYDTFCVRTRSGGYHLYYSGVDVAINQGALGEGLDIRSHNGYVVAPGSLIDGRGYEIVIDGPMQPAPPDIVARCKPPGERSVNAQIAVVDLDTPAAVALATNYIARQEGAVAGTQSEAAYKLACAVRDFGLSEEMTTSLMMAWAVRCMPPIAYDDLHGRVSNAYSYAQNAPGVKHPTALFGTVELPPPPPALENAPAASPAPAFGNLIPLMALPARPWVYYDMLLRQEITSLLAPGGAGKSTLQLVVAIHLALGLDLWGYRNMTGRAWKSIVYDSEDSLGEMSSRVYAICTALNLDPVLAGSRIILASGKTHAKLRLVNGGQNPTVNTEGAAWLVQAASDPDVAMVALNPLNKLHSANGNDNVQMTFVMETLEALAETCDVALFLAHHVSKPSGSTTRMAGNAYIGQGAATIVDSSRKAFTMVPPDDQDVSHFALTPQEKRMLVRLDDAKQNRTLGREEALWLKRVSVTLWNGEHVGSLDKTDMHVRTEHMRQAIARVLHAGMVHQRGSAGVTLTVAAALLKDGDPLFEKMPRDLLKSRIEQYLAQPVTLPDGATIKVDDNRMVVLT